jgi:micrococcal nuclease
VSPSRAPATHAGGQPWTYRYRARVVKVTDGDTLRVALDPGVRLTYDMRVRLRGCNAAEKTTVDGQRAITFVTRWLAENADPDGWVVVITHKDPEDPHDRWVADVTSLDGGRDLTADLIAAGLAVPWDGHGPKPVPGPPPAPPPAA